MNPEIEARVEWLQNMALPPASIEEHGRALLEVIVRLERRRLLRLEEILVAKAARLILKELENG